MHPLFAKHPAFWRAIAGLVLGFAFVASMYGLVFLGPLEPLVMIVASPFFAMQSFTYLAGLSTSAAAVLLPVFFYPVFFAAAGFFWGERQTKTVVVAEGILVALFVACFAYGVFIFSSFE